MSTRTPSAPPWPKPEGISEGQLIKRLCEMLNRVWEAHDPHAHQANDCFCPSRNRLLDFRHSGQSLAWVERVVDEALAARKASHADTAHVKEDRHECG